MPPTENGNKWVSIKWLVSLLLLLVLASGGLIVNDTREGVKTAMIKAETLQEKKLDKEQYYRDVGEIKQSLKEIITKIETLKR